MQHRGSVQGAYCRQCLAGQALLAGSGTSPDQAPGHPCMPEPAHRVGPAGCHMQPMPHIPHIPQCWKPESSLCTMYRVSTRANMCCTRGMGWTNHTCCTQDREPAQGVCSVQLPTGPTLFTSSGMALEPVCKADLGMEGAPGLILTCSSQGLCATAVKSPRLSRRWAAQVRHPFLYLLPA